LGKYYGANIVALEQVWDNLVDYSKLLEDRYVLVLGENVGEFITYGEPRWKEWTNMEPTPPQWNLELFLNFSMLVDRVIGIYVIDITSLA
jgi:hypothetical protein